jgi:hypothetical protein
LQLNEQADEEFLSVLTGLYTATQDHETLLEFVAQQRTDV